MVSFGLKTKYCSLKMDNITVINLKALADRVLWCQVLWPRTVMSSQLAASLNVLWYCIYRKQFKDNKNLIFKSTAELCWPRVKMWSELAAWYDNKFYDRVLWCRVWWPRTNTCCRVLWPRVMMCWKNILSFMAASYVVEFYDRVLWCIVILSFMAACYDDEFVGRGLWCRVSWLRAKNVQSAGHVLKCLVSWSRAKMSSDFVVYIGNVENIFKNLSD